MNEHYGRSSDGMLLVGRGAGSPASLKVEVRRFDPPLTATFIDVDGDVTCTNAIGVSVRPDHTVALPACA